MPEAKPERNVKDWKPVKHSFIKDAEIARQVHENGFCKVSFIDESQLKSLREIYDKHHSFKEGGMFFGHFSDNLDYRRQMHEAVHEVLQPAFMRYFENYRDALSCFVIKAPGQQSEFFIHQDPSFVDEFRYSHLHVWCPLEDMTMDLGPLCVIPHSHSFFYPYRAISIPPPFEKIRPLLRRYLQPLLPKAGEAVFLDSRLIHNSLPNDSGRPRTVILSQIYPKEAKLVTPYYDHEKDKTKLELFALPDDYFMRNRNFLNNVMERPYVGEYLETTEFEFHYMSEEEFIRHCEEKELKPLDLVPPETFENSRMIQEPRE